MRLSELISSLDLAVYPTIGIVLFFAVFLAVSWKALRAPRQAVRHHAALALHEDEHGTGTTSPAGERGKA